MGKYITWLKKQKLRNDPVGDFARDAIHVMKHPADWQGSQPNQSNDLRDWYWAFCGAWSAVQLSMVKSFLEYYKEVGFPRWYKKMNLDEIDADSVLYELCDNLEGQEIDSDDYEPFCEAKTPKRSSVSLRTRFLIFSRDNYRCQICGRSAQDGATLEIDHKTPVANGGNGNRENLWTLCFECNRGKAALPLDATA
jgi:hypothetical protein